MNIEMINKVSMTVKEAIIKVLNENKGSYTYKDVLILIDKDKLIDWSNAKTPSDTIGAQLGDFIRAKDARIKRRKGKKGYEYYGLINEKSLDLTLFVDNEISSKTETGQYKEIDLHKILSSYLKDDSEGKSIYSKTINAQESKNAIKQNNKWAHPDVIGVEFQELENKSNLSILKLINKEDTFKFFSYEIKREIQTDLELKKCFFQAVSNSSWANYGYLVFLDVEVDLLEEIRRLSESFGIGIIHLNANPWETRILYPSKLKSLDFKTMDKLCMIQPKFEDFINKTEKILTATTDDIESLLKKDFESTCDKYFPITAVTEVKEYCDEKKIPYEKESFADIETEGS